MTTGSNCFSGIRINLLHLSCYKTAAESIWAFTADVSKSSGNVNELWSSML